MFSALRVPKFRSGGTPVAAVRELLQSLQHCLHVGPRGRQVGGNLVDREAEYVPDRHKTGSPIQLIVAAALGTSMAHSCSPVVLGHGRELSNVCAGDTEAKRRESAPPATLGEY